MYSLVGHRHHKYKTQCKDSLTRHIHGRVPVVMEPHTSAPSSNPFEISSSSSLNQDKPPQSRNLLASLEKPVISYTQGSKHLARDGQSGPYRQAAFTKIQGSSKHIQSRSCGVGRVTTITTLTAITHTYLRSRPRVSSRRGSVAEQMSSGNSPFQSPCDGSGPRPTSSLPYSCPPYGMDVVSSLKPSIAVLPLHMTVHLPPAGGSLGFCAFSICPMSSSKALSTFSL